MPHGRARPARWLIFFDASTPPRCPFRDWSAAGATRRRADGQPDADRRVVRCPEFPSSGGEIPPEGRPAARRDAHRQPGEFVEARTARPRRARGDTRCSRRPPSRATARRSRCSGGCAKGWRGSSAPCAHRGAALIMEDVCVPPARIAESARDIQALLGKHEFLTGVAGHASAGNLHFLLTRGRRPSRKGALRRGDQHQVDHQLDRRGARRHQVGNRFGGGVDAVEEDEPRAGVVPVGHGVERRLGDEAQSAL